jgi:hypothetical protein
MEAVRKAEEAISASLRAERACHARLRQLNALSAVALPTAREAGIIIMIAEVNGQPLVHITYMNPGVTMERWRRYMALLAEDFGARTEWIDAPLQMRSIAQDILRKDALDD